MTELAYLRLPTRPSELAVRTLTSAPTYTSDSRRDHARAAHVSIFLCARTTAIAANRREGKFGHAAHFTVRCGCAITQEDTDAGGGAVVEVRAISGLSIVDDCHWRCGVTDS